MAAIANFSVSVDTFFTIAGLLVAYNMLRTLEKTMGRINIPMLYLHRYIRLTPTVAAVIGFTATLWPLLGSGPNWFIVDILAGFCRKSWWLNLLYLNNFSELAESGPFGKGNVQVIIRGRLFSVLMTMYSPVLIFRSVSDTRGMSQRTCNIIYCRHSCCIRFGNGDASGLRC